MYMKGCGRKRSGLIRGTTVYFSRRLQNSLKNCDTLRQQRNIAALPIQVFITRVVCFSCWSLPYQCHKLFFRSVQSFSWSSISSCFMEAEFYFLVYKSPSGDSPLNKIYSFCNHTSCSHQIYFNIIIQLESTSPKWNTFRHLMRYLVINLLLLCIYTAKFSATPPPRWNFNNVTVDGIDD